MRMQSETIGQIRLGDSLPPDVRDRRNEFVNKYYELPARIQDRVDETPLPDIVDRIEEADGDAIIRYGMDKNVKEAWNGTIGMQYRANKRWMFRTALGLIGDRKSALAAINYRFLL